jgi:hypothetical protein
MTWTSTATPPPQGTPLQVKTETQDEMVIRHASYNAITGAFEDLHSGKRITDVTHYRLIYNYYDQD